MFCLDKWYFDLVTDAGDAYYLYFMDVSLFGWRWGDVSVHLRLADGQHLHASQNTPTSKDIGDTKQFGRHSLETKDDGTTITLPFDDIQLSFRYQSIGSSWAPENPILLKEGKHKLHWSVPQPVAEVHGSIAKDGHSTTYTGKGCQDFVHMSIPPWKLPMCDLFWGRAHCGEYTVVFDRIVTRTGETIEVISLRQGAEDIWQGRSFSLVTDGGTEIKTERFTLTLDHAITLQDGPVATEERLKWKWLRERIDRFSGHPREQKWCSKATLTIDEVELEGDAIHEHARWRWD